MACDPAAVAGRKAHPGETQILPGHLESNFQRLSIGLLMVDQARGLKRPWRNVEAMPADGLSVGMWTLQEIFGNAGRGKIWGITRRRGSPKELGFQAYHYSQQLPPVVYKVGIWILQDQKLSSQNGMQGQGHRSS